MRPEPASIPSWIAGAVSPAPMPEPVIRYEAAFRTNNITSTTSASGAAAENAP
ncbi:MAG: hypothetical protein ACOC7V_16205 [Spirochaetota bacterium]